MVINPIFLEQLKNQMGKLPLEESSRVVDLTNIPVDEVHNPRLGTEIARAQYVTEEAIKQIYPGFWLGVEVFNLGYTEQLGFHAKLRIWRG